MAGFTNGNLSLNNTPDFFAYSTTNASNVTGNGTTYAIVYQAEDWDIGNDFNTGTGVFTAPIDGIYGFEWVVALGGLEDTGMINANLELRKNGSTWIDRRFNAHAIATELSGTQATGFLDIHGSTRLQLNATDTVDLQITVYGGTGDTVDVRGASGDRETAFSGRLIRLV